MKKFFVIFFTVLIFATPAVSARIADGEEFLPICQTAETHGWEIEWHRTPSTLSLTPPDSTENILLCVELNGGVILNGRIYFPAATLNRIFIGIIPEEIPEEIQEDDTPAETGIHGKLTRVRYGENTAYIFGSMHAGRADWFPLHPIAEDAMSRADIFAFEIDNTTDLSERVLKEIHALMTIPDGETLRRILPDDILREFDRNLQTYEHLGITYRLIRHLTPAALLHEISYLVLETLGVERKFSVDDYIENYAKTNKRPIIGLTSVLQQYKNVFDIPLDIQVYALEDFPDFETWLEFLDDEEYIETYETQDIEAMRAVYAFDSPDDLQLNPYVELINDRHLNVRNLHFSNEIARLLRETKEPTTFFVTMGIWHILGGEGGGQILIRLENEGFEVTPLWS
ncbi:MAG: TraB/GumN family protein [Defluviitaleaceae bacterium]|nr:TraB/GumN family protein [Defluviitaleaceae bacterium]